MYTSTKAQVWGYDLIIAVTIFTIGIIGVYIYATNFASERDSLENLFYQGKTASSMLLEEGTPPDWNPSNYQIPGLVSGGKLNQTKINYFSLLDYDTIKKRLGLSYNYFFYVPNLKVSGTPVEGLGLAPENPKNLVKLERFTIYENKPVKMVMLVWN